MSTIEKDKKAWMLIGQLVGLRKAIMILESRINDLKENPVKPTFGIYDECVDLSVPKYEGQLTESQSNFQLVGSRYGSIKAYFNHNFSEYKDDLNTEISKVECGNTSKNITMLVEITDDLIDFLSEEQSKQVKNNKLTTASIEHKPIIEKQLMKDIKRSFFNNNSSQLEKLNSYLIKNNKTIFKPDNTPASISAMIVSLENLKVFLIKQK